MRTAIPTRGWPLPHRAGLPEPATTTNHARKFFRRLRNTRGDHGNKKGRDGMVQTNKSPPAETSPETRGTSSASRFRDESPDARPRPPPEPEPERAAAPREASAGLITRRVRFLRHQLPIGPGADRSDRFAQLGDAPAQQDRDEDHVQHEQHFEHPLAEIALGPFVDVAAAVGGADRDLKKTGRRIAESRKDRTAVG